MCFWTTKVKTQQQQQQQQKFQHKNPCRELNPGPLAPQSGALTIGHRVI